MRLVLCLAFTGAAAACALAGSSALAQDDRASLTDMEADYMVVMSEADALGRGVTIDESIRFSTNRQSTLRDQLLQTEQLLRQQGMNVQELAEARARFANDDVNVFEDIAKEGAEEIAEKAVSAGMSRAMKRTLGGIGILLDGVENGAEWVVQYMNTSDLMEGLQNGVIQYRQIVDMYSVMSAELDAEIRAQRRLQEILPEARRLSDRIAEERRRLNLPAGPASQFAETAREDDALGDEELALASLADGASRPGPVAGDYDTSYGFLRMFTSGGTYPVSEGRIVVTDIAGSVMEGYWVQSTSGRECPGSRYGRYFGRVRFTFTTEGFTGVWGYCNDQPTQGWSGTRIPPGSR